METRASYLLVGTFVLALIAGLVGFVVWTAGGPEVTSKKYFAYFDGSVNGLNTGSQVRFRGIPVGSVKDIRIVPHRTDPKAKPVQIEVAMEVDANTPVTQSTRAVLELQGITGVAIIQLLTETDDDTGKPPVAVAGEPIEPGPDGKRVVEVKPSTLEEVFKSVPELLAELKDLAGQGKKLLSDENVASLSTSFKNFEGITKNLEAGTKDLDELVKNGNVAFENIKPAIDKISQASESFSKASQQIAILVETNQRPLADFTSSGLYEISNFFVEARGLVDSLSRITKRLEEDPSRYLLGTSQEGYRPRK